MKLPSFITSDEIHQCRDVRVGFQSLLNHSTVRIKIIRIVDIFLFLKHYLRNIKAILVIFMTTNLTKFI